MKTENLKSITIAILLFIIFLQLKGCNNQTTTIPEVKGSFKAIKPTSNTKQLIDPTTKKIDKTVAKTLKNEYTFNQSEIDTMAIEIQRLEFIADSLSNINYELSQIVYNYSKINEFKSDLSDDNIEINVSGITFKNVAERVKIDYTIKERKIKTNKGLFIGGQFGADTNLNNFTYKIDADYLYKNKIYKASFQRFGDVDFILVGGSLKVF